MISISLLLLSIDPDDAATIKNHTFAVVSSLSVFIILFFLANNLGLYPHPGYQPPRGNSHLLPTHIYPDRPNHGPTPSFLSLRLRNGSR
jgi:hypothetical protein